jgi:DNA-binding FrmR family transcriptional regulator
LNKQTVSNQNFDEKNEPLNFEFNQFHNKKNNIDEDTNKDTNKQTGGASVTDFDSFMKLFPQRKSHFTSFDSDNWIYNKVQALLKMPYDDDTENGQFNNEDFDCKELFDIADKSIWNKDEKGFYKNVNNGKVYEQDIFNELKNNNNNCFGVGLVNIGESQCRNVMNCLLADSLNAGSECSEIFKQFDAVSVAKRDLKNVIPTELTKLLLNLGFKVEESLDYPSDKLVKKFISVEKWIKEVLSGSKFNQKGFNAENNGLITYLK